MSTLENSVDLGGSVRLTQYVVRGKKRGTTKTGRENESDGGEM
jgi:hypothetical protein